MLKMKQQDVTIVRTRRKKVNLGGRVSFIKKEGLTVKNTKGVTMIQGKITGKHLYRASN